MDYAGALDYLDRHINREATAGRVGGLSLEPIRRLVGVLGDPQRAFKVVHVTGTNGKGSVARMVSALLVEHGLSVGTYSSPHLERINERLAWNLEPISDHDFAALITDIAELEPLAGVTPSYFELLTAAALSWFAHSAVDVAVVEVGLLGRFDATNVVDADVAVITNIGFDHTDGVGDWRAAIASEKAGIIKPGSFLVLGETDPELREIFEREPHAGTWVRGEDFDVEQDRVAVGGRLLDLRTPGGVIEDVFVPLHGRHQADNAALAVAAAEAFFARALDVEVVRAAFAGLTVPGRFEVLGHFPLVIVDGAHNPDGASALADTMNDEFDVGGRRILVVGMLAERDVGAMLDALDVGSADVLVACTAPSPRAVPAEVIAQIAQERFAGLDVEVVAGVEAAVNRALAIASEDDVVLVTGSIYVAGAARAHLTR
ncbi:bifunctional folylpolyglutamate synthase/dihydrofolate synthase [Rhabdothermincola sp.]|uniref:bifunctional folylpolyglutamate synthase/dihydrofolate synthase n=1 Tax=Rhabdothermincola sp. TaxID=2820405 RepID=UPI002FE134A8